MNNVEIIEMRLSRRKEKERATFDAKVNNVTYRDLRLYEDSTGQLRVFYPPNRHIKGQIRSQITDAAFMEYEKLITSS